MVETDNTEPPPLLQKRQDTNQLPLYNEKSSATAPNTATPSPPVALPSLTHKNDTPVLVRVLCLIALFPVLYFVHAFVLSPVAQWIGHAALRHACPSSGVTAGLKTIAKREVEKGTAEFGVFAALIPILVILSGIFAGLTLGYMSLDMTQLTILATSGTPLQQEYAKKIMPVRSNGHQLLTTLLLVNMIVNETLPVISDPVLGGGVQAVVVSTVLIIIFAEIIPQSICSRYGLLVGAKAAAMTQILIYIAYPIAKPVSLLLEKILGHHNGIIYRKAELRELLNLHAMAGMHGGDLLGGTVTMAQGALDLQDKSVFAHMTPIESVFMLEDTTKLDYEVLSKVVQSGHSRIPVYKTVEIPDITGGAGKTRKIKKILGTMLVKNCVLLDPEDATPITSIPISSTTTVPQDEPLLNMLNAFREGRSHMALVSRRKRVPKVDESDIDEQSVIETAAGGLRERIRRKLAGSDTSDSSDDDQDLEMGEMTAKKLDRKKSKRELKKDKRAADREKAEVERKETKKQGQGVPGDAFLQPGTVDKLMGDIEGETIGIITLEDVLEELIGNEIEDEYDQHDEAGNAVHAFVPEEAHAFIAKANQDRARLLASDKARAQSTPVPSAVAEKPKPAAQATELVPSKPKTVAGAFVSKLGAGMGIRRTTSAPGKKRTAEDQEKAEAAFATGGAGTPTETIGEVDEKSALNGAAIVPATSETEVGSDEEKLKTQTQTKATDFANPQGETEDLASTTASSTPLQNNQVVLPASAASSAPNLPAVVPTPAMLAEALERGRKRGPPGALLAPGGANVVNTRSPSVPVSGASTPLGTPGVGPVKKKTFKSTPTSTGLPTLRASKTFNGSPLTEEPKNL